MAPSKGSLDRLSRTLGEGWEAHREAFEASFCDAIRVPEGSVSVSASLDGVMVPMKRPPGEESSDTLRKSQGKDEAEGEVEERDTVEAADKESGEKKPFYREASCATLSFRDEAGKRLDTVRFGRMPEPGKKALKSHLSQAVAAALGQCPELQLVKLAYGTKDNWRFLADEL